MAEPTYLESLDWKKCLDIPAFMDFRPVHFVTVSYRKLFANIPSLPLVLGTVFIQSLPGTNVD